ncbi:MAG TPA: PilZ domain-containing protein [Vicinamibacteria bacterium]|nr:PilZ domain-containing protein [Vicinamibacteria bacterium]
MPAVQAHIVDVFQQYSRLYELRNRSGGQLSPEFHKEWVEVTFTLESIFSGLYRPDPADPDMKSPTGNELRRKIPVNFLRVPTDADVLCETEDNFFSGKLQDISVGGAYVHSPIPFSVDLPVRLTFCTFRDRVPLEIDARIAWNNPGSVRKQTLPEGAGLQFTHCDTKCRGQLQDYVYELVEDTLARANLI